MTRGYAGMASGGAKEDNPDVNPMTRQSVL